MENLHLCPIPYLLLDRQFNLIDASNTGYDFLMPGENFMSIVEEESSPKFARIIHKHPKGEMELNVKKTNTFELFDIYFQFSDVQQYYHVVLIAKDQQYKKVSEQMNGLFDLMGNPAYSRKEPNLTEALAKISSLFLKLSNTSDWNRQEVMDKIKEIEHHIQQNVK
ncbi:hypothetical protein [Rossellomorea vietnamensis]|uniref:Uncharacterized protein n=1 Tax=Rossellomorea vietnamensis TaxID=218284 RepID=A0A6I6UKP1_9BACI|nr:hypothetical protein [Rossellomorea vietnamensis]OXS64333.1 hypothetical protein B1B00_01015 [Bacillus sp. DSM 27956]PRX79468.1 hypothetical protein B0G93_101215 [Bacillus sp. V-88]QHE60119.1 hypothetical protein FHE72_03070 [Rossellomorea vietnamensis]SLJ95311.1 hypothetical protein SAMN06295884_101215 [Bacillus sp. V-88]